MTNLYELTKEFRRLLTILESDDYLSDSAAYAVAQEALDDIQEARDAKLEGCMRVWKSLEAEVHAIEAELKLLKKRKERSEKNLEWLKGWVAGNLLKQTFRCAIGEFKWRTSEAVVPEVEGAEIPPQYARVKVITEPDKTEMKKDLKCGANIPGWRLERRSNLVLS